MSAFQPQNTKWRTTFILRISSSQYACGSWPGDKVYRAALKNKCGDAMPALPAPESDILAIDIGENCEFDVANDDYAPSGLPNVLAKHKPRPGIPNIANPNR